MHAPRSAFRAFLLSLLLPGFGQLYNGDLNKAISLFLVTAVAVKPLIATLVLYTTAPWQVLALGISLTVIGALWLYGLFDAVHTARRQQDYQHQPWQCGGVYLAIGLLCILLILPSVNAWVRHHWGEFFLVPSQSMQPTLLPNDLLFADKRYNRIGGQPIRRGDIVIFTYPNDRSVYFVKRIIGLPGDKIQVRGTDVSVNGQPLRLATIRTDDGLLITEANG
ncbi:MAG: signal peptidase I, partial [Thiothrix sp.]